MSKDRANQLAREAALDGIESFDTVRTAVIVIRNSSLDKSNFEDAAFFTHVIWWLNRLNDSVHNDNKGPL